MMGDILGRHQDIAYWIEPKYIWRYRNPQSGSDVRTPDEATAEVASYLHEKFLQYKLRLRKSRFMEKTPSNCFRIPFMHRIFPDGLFLHVVRDGRDVAFSALRKWTAPPSKGALIRRAKSFEIPLRDSLWYASDFLRDVVARQIFPQRGYIWGPRFPGIEELRAKESLLLTCAIQWQESVNALLDGLKGLPPEQIYTLRFEDFLCDPALFLDEIYAFLDLNKSARVNKFAADFVDRTARERWRTRDPQEVDGIAKQIGSTLTELGYSA